MYDKVIIVGTGRFSFQCALLFSKYCQSVALYEYKDSILSLSERLCSKHGILYKSLDKRSMGEELLKLVDEKVLVVSAINTYLFTEEFLRKENITVINYHNAYLPNHPGRNAEAWSIYEGDCETGVTWHYVISDVDAGSIIAQEKIKIEDDMTALSLLKTQNERAYLLLESFAGKLMQGNVDGIPQKTGCERKMHFSKDIPNNGFVDISWDVKMIYRFLRSMDYGALKNLGTPLLRLEDRTYMIIGYRLIQRGEEMLQDSTKENYVFDDGIEQIELDLKECL